MYDSYYTRFARFPQGGIVLRSYLAITPGALAQLPSPPALPLALMAYAVGPGGCLTRCGAVRPSPGALMGLSDRCAGSIQRPDALCRAVAAECVKNRLRGVLADFDGAPCSDRLAFLNRLARRLNAQGLRLYCPRSLPAEDAVLLVGTAVSGGSLRTLLEGAVNRHGPERLALDLERVQMDFPLPCPSGCGTPLTHGELLALQQKHAASVYYSRELAANYFTYSEEGRAHFVLFDDAETLRRKCALAQSLGIQEAFVMYPEVADLLPAPGAIAH